MERVLHQTELFGKLQTDCNIYIIYYLQCTIHIIGKLQMFLDQSVSCFKLCMSADISIVNMISKRRSRVLENFLFSAIRVV